MKKTLVILSLLVNINIACAQIAEHTIIGIAGSVIPDGEPLDSYIEYSGILNCMLSINPSLYVGLEYVHMRAVGSILAQSNNVQDFNTFSLINHINLINEDKLRVFFQANADYSNYCLCDRLGDPIVRPHSIYAGWGMGLNYRVVNQVSVDVGFKYSYLLNRGGENPLTMTYWSVGLNYDIKRKI